MTGESIAFFILALTAIAGGVMMINMSNVIHMVVALVFTFLAIAGIYITLSAEFVAAVQVLIYSGAITIIMLFGIMLTRHERMTEWKLPKMTVLLSGAGILVFFLIMFFGINRLSLGNPATDLHIDNTKKIGVELYSKYVIPFELTSVLLLVALIGAIVIAKRDDEKEAGK
ncbi:NADH-quinone oxidoreductase subunit J [Fictibacillus enclensis]|uniref:NADH-quinone oxidoreductase subunit J n=1 Tax=Fictibacillus enclensis TaxID=1017270 RepID=A0A0V8J426_9BACL|nr:NADH-quinone oxidoreductase subunit J [Fictibacillus enclensis]KSU81871.1 NADH:ubiquinone oxidoreductase subunit J [Fictibacillus enclensis]SCC27270.1 NADH-quinone oxidoreductase subunit J [Fictibacillus enclensis]